MKQGILKRNPDAGVANAVSSIIEHQKFKRMLMFGLRSLSDFCSSSVQLYLENAMDALDRDVVPSIHQAVSNFGDDEELAQSASKILFAMSLAVVKESNNALSTKLANDGGVETVILLIDHISFECETLEFCVEFLLNMDSYIKTHVSTFNFVKHLIGFAENKKISPQLLLKVVTIFHTLSEFDNGVQGLHSSNALVELFKYALDLNDTSIELPLAIFKLLKKLGSKVKCDTSLEYAINLMEKFRSNRNVLERGNDAVKLLIGPERLEQCLNTLQKGETGSNEYKTAILTLKSLSYISDAASEIAKGGGAVLLLDLVNNALASKDQEEKEAIISGSCAMLTRLSLHPDCVNDLLAKGVIEILTNILISCKTSITCVAAASEALSKAIQIPDSSNRVKKSRVFEIALPLLYEYADKTEAIFIMELVHSGTLNSDFLEIIVSSNGLEIVSACCQYHLENVNFHALAVSSLNNLSSLEINLKSISDYGGLVGLSTSLTRNSSDVNYSYEALKVLSAFSSLKNATTYMCDGNIAEACLKCMIEHRENQKIIELGTKCLGVIATEKDLQRNTDNLKEILLNFSEMGDKPFTMLASIAGLSKIERLKHVLVNEGIINIITESVGCLIDQPIDQNLVVTKIALIKSALSTATSLNFLQDETDTSTIQVFSDLACLSNVKRLVEIEQNEENLFLHFIDNMKTMSSYYRNLDEEAFAKALESLLKIMRKYQDIRRVQIACMDAVYTLITTSGPFHSAAIVSSGLVNAVINYLQRVPMYVDVQLTGLKLLLLCAKSDRSDTVIKCLVDCGSLGVIKTASRTHVRNIQLKPILGSLMSMLLPTDAIEQELVELLKQCQEHVNKKDLYNLQLTFTSINQLLASQDVIKMALKINILTRLKPLVKFAVSHKKPMGDEEGMSQKEIQDSCLSEISHIFFNACQLRLGRVAATKQETVKELVSLYKALEAPVNVHTSETAASSLETLSILLKHDKSNANLCYENEFCEQLCDGVKLFQGSSIVLNATCACLASFCTTEERVQLILKSKGFAPLAESLVSAIASEGKRDAILNSLIALAELFKTEIPILLQYFAMKTKVIPALFGILSNYPYDRHMVNTASECLEKLLREEDPNSVTQSEKSNRIFILDNLMNCNKDDPDTLGNILEVLVGALGTDATLLKQSGVFETISNLMNLHQDHQKINYLGGKIVGILGADEQIKILMRYIIEQGLASEIIPQNVDSAASKLAMFLTSPLNDRNNALQFTEECLKATNNVISYLASNERLMTNLSAVSRRLCESAYNDMEDQFGAWAVASSANLNQLANVFVTDYGLGNVAFLTNCFFVFAACQHNNYTREAMSNLCGMILPHMKQIIKKYSGNNELIHSLLTFLNELKLTNLADLGLDVDELIELLRKYINDDTVVIPILEILSTLINANEKGPALDEILSKVSLLSSLPLGEGSPQRQKAYLEFNAAIASKARADKTQINNLFNLYDNISSTETLDPNVAMIITNLVGSLGADKEMAKCVLDRLEKLADEYSGNVQVIVSILEALTAFARHNPHTSGGIVNHPVLVNLTAEMLSNKQVSSKAMELLEFLSSIPGISSLVLERLEKLAKLCPELKEHPSYKRVFDLLNAECNLVKTCKMIYDELSKLTPDQLDPSFQTDNISSMLNLMKKYNTKEMNLEEKSDGADFTFGCMAFEMLGSSESRCHALVATELPALLVDALNRQNNFKLLNTIVTTLCNMCQFKSVAAKVIQATVSGVEAGASHIISSYFGRLEKSNLAPDQKEDCLINSMLLIAQTAVNRKIYSKTPIISTAIKIWNDYDKKIYSKIRLMRQLFRTVRNVVNESHLESLIKEDIIKRIKLLVDTCNDLYLLPDAFFLIGSMAAVPTIKSQMGDYGLLESLVKAQRNYIDGDMQSNALLTNCCLALANMCIDYKPNCDIFQKFGGPDLNIKILNKFSKVPEIVNGASILLCNALYKNDGLKLLYGHNGGPAALMKCLAQFSGICEKPTLRCVEILLKSISNLSLNANNLEYFLKCDSEKAFEKWLTGLNAMDKSGFDAEGEDQLYHVGLQTLSNLLAENKKESMEKFSVLIAPSFTVLKSARLNSKSVILLFDILSSLSRLPANFVKFGQEGIPLIVSTLRRFDYDVELLSLGIHLLSLQSYTPEGTLLLLKSNVFDILIGTLQVDPDDSDCLGLIISSLRCIRRIISSSEIAYFFCGVGGVAPLVDIIKKAVNHHMLMVETGRLLLGLLSFTENADGNSPSKIDNYFEGWKNIELSLSDVNNILLAVVSCSTAEGYKRIVSLQRTVLGICGYFSQAGIGYEAMASANLAALLQEVLTYSTKSPLLLESVAHILYGLRIAPPDLITTIVPNSVNKLYRECIKKMPNKKPAEREIYLMAESAIDRLEAPSRLEPGEKLNPPFPGGFNFSLSGWDVDPYPNGVQDLPQSVKDTLRKGDKCVIITNDLNRVNSKWRSTQDLNCLEWGPEEQSYPNRVPILRVKNIASGIKSPVLEAAARRDSRKVTHRTSACIVCAASVEFPEGVSISLLFKTQKHRDEMVELLAQWRDAASYNH